MSLKIFSWVLKCLFVRGKGNNRLNIIIGNVIIIIIFNHNFCLYYNYYYINHHYCNFSFVFCGNGWSYKSYTGRVTMFADYIVLVGENSEVVGLMNGG
jgi:hypothetical protein